MQRLTLLNIRHTNFWLLLIVITGIILRSIHFFGRSSMWFDELTCALNIQTHSYFQLATQSLEYNQVAPMGFLLFEKLATSLFGENDFAFRFFPWLWSMVSLVLFLKIAKHFLQGFVLIAALMLFAYSVTQWFYGGEAKQYSGDVTAALFLVWSGLQMMREEVKTSTVLLIAGGGFLAIISSLPAVVIAPFLLSILFTMLVKNQINISKKYFFSIALFWVASCAWGVWYAQFVISETVQEAMTGYWNRGFAPSQNVSDYFEWIYVTIAKELSFFLTAWMEFTVPQITLISKVLLLLSIPGIIFLVRQQAIATLIFFSPVLIAIFLATARILPFDGRVAIYASWPFIISGLAGVTALQYWLPLLFRPVVALAVSMMIALPIILLTIMSPAERPPFNGQSSQPVIRKLKEQLQPGDILYVYFKARHALNFYGPKESVTNYITGNSYDSIVPFLREVDKFKGNKRVWFFFSQWTPKQPFPDSIKTYLGNVIGKEILKIPDPDGNVEDLEVAAHLYDLSGIK